MWSDDNGNGRRASGESGIVGVTVYGDANFNGFLDSLGKKRMSSVYRFAYSKREVFRARETLCTFINPIPLPGRGVIRWRVENSQ